MPKGAAERSGMPLALKLVLAAAGVGVLVFAVQGGEWGTLDLLKQQKRLARIRHEVDSLQHEVDSLTAYKKALQTDPVLQERIAREEFGMTKGPKELLYRFTEPARGDTGKGATKK
jgi:cell division protein FtsB